MGRPITDLTGQKFGDLTVIERGYDSYSQYTLWLCACDCGRERIVRADNLKSGNTKTCGVCSGKRGGKKVKVMEHVRIIHAMAQEFADYIDNDHDVQCAHRFINKISITLAGINDEFGADVDMPGKYNYIKVFSNCIDGGNEE